ncbi:class I SAM-dependent methyltransferase [Qipengyuania sp. YG27]|uniref:Class I SAM-dependent methyltransferase n=1 Tax=Qipengyuania mesophila TaxID=2867246 RepID=A0ABS7JQW9_9SPHN|nr:class I SAM-dependent methyltransferase [Qipengyuania mesophila]MBX7500045.1 class I SAM-dependent methyltransferase [Qipengyuania mesophila]
MTDHRDWTGKVGSIWAREWRRTDRSFRELTPELMAAIESHSFSSVVDIGCGAGEISCRIAEAHPDVPITGVDIAPELLDVARERASGLPNVGFIHGDAAQATIDQSPRPDLLVSRHGVMFFVDPIAAFDHLRSQIGPGAALVFSCFRERSNNAWVEETLSALPAMPPPVDPSEPGPFAFGSRDRVEGILQASGWQDISFEALDYRMTFGEGDDAVGDARDYLSHVGPTATPISLLEGAEREATLDRLSEVLTRHESRGVVALPAAAWIVTARAPG